MTRTRTARTTLVAAGALTLALPGAAHAAAPTPVTGGTTTVRPAGAAYRTLARAGVRVRAVGEARGTRATIALPVREGLFGRVTLLQHASTDGLLLDGRDEDVRLTDLRVRLGKASRVTGRIDGGEARTLFVLRASGLTRRGAALHAGRSKVSWRLSAAAARTLRTALGAPRLRAGTFATARLTATLAAPAPPVAPPTPPAPGAPSGPSAQVVAGSASWGIKASFRRYVGGSGGSIATSDGATVAADGTYAFGAGTGTVDRATGGVAVGFRGTVYFENHGKGDAAAMRVWVRNPRVASDGTTATLHADVSSKDGETGTIKDYPDVAFATLDLAAGTRTVTDTTVTWTAIPAALTEAGSKAFAGFYGAGVALDPLSFSVTTG